MLNPKRQDLDRMPLAGHRTQPECPGGALELLRFTLFSSLLLLLASSCVWLPPGTSAGAAAARQSDAPIVLGGSGVPEAIETDNGWRTGTRSADLLHISAELTVDLESNRLYGSATSSFRMLRTGVRSIRLGAESIEVREIVDGDGRALAHRTLGNEVIVGLEESLPVGDEVSITVRYAARNAAALRASLGDDSEYRPEVYALSQRKQLRRWLPTGFGVGELATMDLSVTVRDQMTVVSNGVLTGVEEAPDAAAGSDARIYRWVQRDPIPPDAVAFAAARFTTFASEGAGTELYFHLPEGTPEEVAELNFGASAAVLAHCEERLGAAFPFARYDQVVLTGLSGWVHDGASMALIDARDLAEDQDRLDGLDERRRRAVSRGLASKWFGAWLTPLDESHRWLLDGLACQLELDFEESVRGEAEVALEWDELRERLVGRSRELRDPNGVPEDPQLAAELDAFRAGWAQRIIRARLGEADYWRLVRRFLARSVDSGRAVTAEDFRRTALEELGVDLGPELVQWSQRIGVPELEVTLQRRNVVTVGESLGVRVRQVQPGPLFRAALEVSLHFEGGTSRTETMVLDREETLMVVRLDSPLIDVTVDPRGVLLADFSVAKDESSWLAQALLSRSSVERRRATTALQALAERGSPPAEAALVRLLLESPEPSLREHVATAVTFPGPVAIGGLLQAATDDTSPRVRRAALRGLYQAYAAERWLPAGDDLARLFELRQREEAPAVLDQITRLLDTIPAD